MKKLKAGIDFIFSSYKRTALAMLVLAFALSLPITTTFVSQNVIQKKVLGINIGDGPLLAQSTGGACVVGENDCPAGQTCVAGGAGSTQGTCQACTARPANSCIDARLDPVSGNITSCAPSSVPGASSFCPNQAPTTSTVTIDPSPVKADGSTEYMITITSTDPQGGDTIFRQFVIINYGGQPRGYVGWSTDSFARYWGSNFAPPTSGSPAYPYRCVSGGGAVAIYGGTDYGPQYITTRWCSTSVSGNTRTTKMYVKFNTNFTVPVTGNTLSGFTEDSGNLYENWKQLGTFNLESQSPTSTNAVITPSIVVANGTSQYKITVTSTDPQGGNTITRHYAVTNLGQNNNQFRGLVGWSTQGFAKYWGSSYKTGTNPIDCTGGGKAVVYGGNGGENYGMQYINLVSCVTSTSGTTRTTEFTVTFNSTFTTPQTNNTISAFTEDATEIYDNWKPFGTFILGANQAPTTTNATINPPSISANGITQHVVTVISTDPQGGDSIASQIVSLNNPNDTAAPHRGIFGWSSKDFNPYWNSNFKTGTTPLACTGGGKMAIYGGGYGPQYVNAISCSTSTSGNTRTTQLVVTYNNTFTAPTANKIYAFTDDNGGLYDNWKPFADVGLGATCPLKNRGDADCNDRVNNSDYELWKTTFIGLFSATPPSSANQAKVDFNNDTKVDTDDFNIWRAGNFDQSIQH